VLVDLRQLEQFVAVAEQGSFTRAATRMHVVQSGMSATVAGLERELRVTLFDRTTRRVVLTDAGQTLLAHAREIMEAVERAEASVASVAGGARGTVRVGIMHSLLAPPVAQALADFHLHRPNVDLRPQTSRDGSAGLVQAVIDNELDLAFAAATPAQSSKVDMAVISSEKMVLVCPPGHRLARRRSVPIGELVDEAFVDVPIGWGSRASTDQLFARHRLQRQIEVEVGDVATVLDLVRVGLGIALVAPSSTPNIDDLVVIQPKPAPTFDVYMVLPKNRQVKPAAQALADMVTDRLDRP